MTSLFFNMLRRLFRNLRSEYDRRASDDMFRLIAEQSVDVICRLGPDQRIRYISPSAHRLFGLRPAELTVLGLNAIVAEEDAPIITAAVQGFAKGQAETATTQVRVVRPDGRLVWVEANARRVSTSDTASDLGFDTVLVMRDITDRKLHEQRLAVLAREDGLTGLANRRAFDEILEQTWRRTVAEGSQMALILLDVDHFKCFNDRYGHQVGDDCLRTIAATVKNCAMLTGELTARYGGEEMAITIADSDVEGATALAEQIRSAVAALRIPHAVKEGNPWVTVSLGVSAAFAGIGGTVAMPGGLLQAADAALYRAKANGRNRLEALLVLAPEETSCCG